MKFLTDHFLLDTETARRLYHDYAQGMPILDYHCHVSPREIYEDRHFDNLFQVWLGGDHYKWRLMRNNGVEERYITGDAPEREKFQKFAETLPRAIGNPLYHWCHLELKNYFGYDGVLNGETAQEVWDLAADKLKTMGVRDMIARSNVAFIGTTDDPTDTLEWHEKIAEDSTIQTVVAPSFRPDKALNIHKAGWLDYIRRLGAAAGVEIDSLDTLKEALSRRIDFFSAHGCRASDHGLDHMVFLRASDGGAESVFLKGLAGQPVSLEDGMCFQTELLLFCARRYRELGWVMQLHFNCIRNPNTAMLAKLGSDCGFDCIGPGDGSAALAGFLDTLFAEGNLPKTILYSLDPGDNQFLDTLIGSFQGPEVAGKIQHGSAWWFNDHFTGMTDQLTSLANLAVLGNFVGMLTDSRSFLSYARHEYFRRILCRLLGRWVEDGMYPADMETLGGLVQDICSRNATRYFNLEGNIK